MAGYDGDIADAGFAQEGQRPFEVGRAADVQKGFVDGLRHFFKAAAQPRRQNNGIHISPFRPHRLNAAPVPNKTAHIMADGGTGWR